MKAVRIHRYGPPGELVFEDVERPAPGEGEVLVRVKAAGVGPWDALIRSGKSGLPLTLPLTLGTDFAGSVETIGPDVHAFQPGDEVFGATNASFIGAYAEYAIASAAMLAKKPRTSSDVEAASVPVVAVTADQMLFEHAGVRGGQTVLVHGAAGAVGAYAVQLARLAGARVIATAHTRDVDYVRSLGAEKVVDSRVARFESASGLVDAVVDTLGGDMQKRSFDVLKRGGVLVSSVSQPDQTRADRVGVRTAYFIVKVTSAALARAAESLDSGTVKPSVGAVLSLADAREAHEMMAGAVPRPRGRIVLKVGA